MGCTELSYVDTPIIKVIELLEAVAKRFITHICMEAHTRVTSCYVIRIIKPYMNSSDVFPTIRSYCWGGDGITCAPRDWRRERKPGICVMMCGESGRSSVCWTGKTVFWRWYLLPNTVLGELIPIRIHRSGYRIMKVIEYWRYQPFTFLFEG